MTDFDQIKYILNLRSYPRQQMECRLPTAVRITCQKVLTFYWDSLYNTMSWCKGLWDSNIDFKLASENTTNIKKHFNIGRPPEIFCCLSNASDMLALHTMQNLDRKVSCLTLKRSRFFYFSKIIVEWNLVKGIK